MSYSSTFYLNFCKYQFLTLRPRGRQEVAKTLKGLSSKPSGKCIVVPIFCYFLVASEDRELKTGICKLESQAIAHFSQLDALILKM